MIAPNNDFEACFTQIMKRQSPKLDLVAAGYNGRFVRSHPEADFFLSSPFVDHQGCRVPLIGDQTRPDQAIERPRVWSPTGNWKPELKRDLTDKPSSDEMEHRAWDYVVHYPAPRYAVHGGERPPARLGPAPGVWHFPRSGGPKSQRARRGGSPPTVQCARRR